MTAPSRLDLVRTLLTEYARRTGLDGDSAAPRRYLWTDAFAVCTCLGLARATGDDAWLERALRLVDQVHATLGRHRADDPREGWLSGLSEEEGRAHPTRGGLRIGKPAPERGLGEPLDPRREWDRDGQYFHYATKWMHALAQVARATGEARYLEQAIELARATCTGFTLRSPTGEPRLAWKMSVDLSRPQVPSTGQHDALDGWLTLRCLRADARRAGRSAAAASLAGPIEELRALDAGASWATADALGIGGLLCDALRASRLAARDGDGDEEGEGNGAATMLGPRLLDAAALGLAALVPTDALRGPAARRLAFRELGLALGLHAVERVDERAAPDPSALRASLERVRPYLPLASHLEAFWVEPAHRATDAWLEHEDIDAVMLAASLLPDGFLDGPRLSP